MPDVLAQCRTCPTRTLPNIAAARWPQGRCTLCQDPQEGAAVARKLELAQAAFRRQDQEHANG